MALDVTPVNRNLHTRVTFMSLEFEDLFVVLGLAAVMNVVSHFFDGNVSAVLQYAVPLADSLCIRSWRGIASVRNLQRSLMLRAALQHVLEYRKCDCRKHKKYGYPRAQRRFR